MKNCEPLVPTNYEYFEVKVKQIFVLTWTSIGHRQEEGLLVLQRKVLVVELRAVDRLSPSTIASGEITSLAHERLYDAVEAGALVMKRHSIFGFSLLTSTQCAEVLCGDRNDWSCLLGGGSCLIGDIMSYCRYTV
jgi:hypothetical protein